MTPAITVAVCTRNRPARVDRCVRSILVSPLRDLELLVVDQSDGDETGVVLRAIGDCRLRHLRTTSRGLARARNLAVEQSDAPVVLFTDDDCRVEPTWPERFLAEFARDPSLDAVYGRVLPGEEPRPGLVCFTVMTSDEPRLVTGLGWERVQDAVGHGNAMAFRRSCFARHGLFLEWLGAGTAMAGGEDMEFALRILRAGACVRYSPAPVAYHDNWMSPEASHRQLYRYKVSAGAVLTRLLLRGHAAALRVALHDLASTLLIGSRGLRRRNTAELGHALRLLRAHAAGLAWGIAFALRRSRRYEPGLGAGPG